MNELENNPEGKEWAAEGGLQIIKDQMDISIIHSYDAEDIHVLYNIINNNKLAPFILPRLMEREGFSNIENKNYILGLGGITLNLMKKALKKPLIKMASEFPMAVLRTMGLSAVSDSKHEDLAWWVSNCIELYHTSGVGCFDTYEEWFGAKYQEIKSLLSEEAEEIVEEIVKEPLSEEEKDIRCRSRLKELYEDKAPIVSSFMEEVESKIVAEDKVAPKTVSTDLSTIFEVLSTANKLKKEAQKLQKEEESKNKDIEGEKTPQHPNPNSPKENIMSNDEKAPVVPPAPATAPVVPPAPVVPAMSLEQMVKNLLIATADAKTVATTFQQKLEEADSKVVKAETRTAELQKQIDSSNEDEPSWYHYSNKRSQAFVAGAVATGVVVAGVSYYNKSKSGDVSVDNAEDNVIQFDSADYAQG